MGTDGTKISTENSNPVEIPENVDTPRKLPEILENAVPFVTLKFSEIKNWSFSSNENH